MFNFELMVLLSAHDGWNRSLDQVAGSALPLIEMQARWIGHVFAGDCVLPPDNVMRAKVQHRIDNCWPGYGRSIGDAFRSVTFDQE